MGTCPCTSLGYWVVVYDYLCACRSPREPGPKPLSSGGTRIYIEHGEVDSDAKTKIKFLIKSALQNKDSGPQRFRVGTHRVRHALRSAQAAPTWIMLVSPWMHQASHPVQVDGSPVRSASEPVHMRCVWF